ncbi:MAG: site-specific integrase [Lactobacillus sp.]|nr:site-specific integrase [Lactobacillus sp.]
MAKITEYQTSKGKFYRFRVYAGIDEMTGKKKYIKRAGFKTKVEAKKELVKIEYDVSSGNYFKPSDVMTFKEVYKLWYDQHRLTVKESTCYLIRQYFRLHILPAIGSYNVNVLNLAICQRAVNQWYKVRPRSYKNMLAYASAVGEYAIKLELTNVNYFKSVTKPKQKAKKLDHNFLDGKELNKYLAVAKKKGLNQYALFRTLAYSGMRIGELLALTWDDVSFLDNTININKTLSRTLDGKRTIKDPKTKSSKRLLNMDNETMKILKRWQVQQASYLLKCGINAMSSKQLVFTGVSNNLFETNRVREWHKVITNEAGVPWITLHGFRHTHATLLLSAGASVKEVQTRLGHSKVQTTLDIYTHLTKKDQKETINKLVRYLG